MARIAAPTRRATTRGAHTRRPNARGTPRPDRAPQVVGRVRTWTRYARAAFLIPALAYVLFVFVLPIVYNLILSFEQTSPATIANLFAPFAGISNYKDILIQSTTQSAIIRTFTFTFASLFFQFFIGFGLALLFNMRFPLRRVARSLIIIPWLLPLLITGFIFRFLFQTEAGAINQILQDVHLISHPIGFLTSPGWAYFAVLVANIWLGIPFFTVLLYSALQDVPVELKEAAMLDGANAWQRLIRVTLPIVRPVIEVVIVLGFVFTIKVFDLVIGMTEGGPANSTEIMAPWAYNVTFEQFEYGQGAALNTILLLIAFVAAPVYIWLNRESLRR
jgi:multiple sugar transport system permease protein